MCVCVCVCVCARVPKSLIYARMHVVISGGEGAAAAAAAGKLLFKWNG